VTVGRELSTRGEFASRAGNNHGRAKAPKIRNACLPRACIGDDLIGDRRPWSDRANCPNCPKEVSDVDDTSPTEANALPADRLDAGRLLPLVYEKLRRLAWRRMEREAPGQTLQPTALVHEAYMRLVGNDPGRRWNSPGHFLAAAAEAMRRILVDRARNRRRLKRGGRLGRVDLDAVSISLGGSSDELIDLDEALTELGREDPLCAHLVELRFFAGLTQSEAAEHLGLPRRTADRHWAYARAWLFERLRPREARLPADSDETAPNWRKLGSDGAF
jgi:RNA polymerase sigma factor (TIGR02999 family)